MVTGGAQKIFAGVDDLLTTVFEGSFPTHIAHPAVDQYFSRPHTGSDPRRLRFVPSTNIEVNIRTLPDRVPINTRRALRILIDSKSLHRFPQKQCQHGLTMNQSTPRSLLEY